MCVCVCVCKGDSPPNSDGSVVRAVMGDGGAFKEAANPVQGLGRLSQRKGIPVLSSEGRRGHWAQKPRGERGCGVLREEQIPCEKEKRERQAGEVSRGQPAGLGGMATNPDCVLRQQEEPRTDSNSPLWLLCRGERREAGSPGRAWGHPEQGRGGKADRPQGHSGVRRSIWVTALA